MSLIALFAWLILILLVLIAVAAINSFGMAPGYLASGK
jgi:hypothetical protein